MDFTEFQGNTSDEGVPCHLRSPKTGELTYIDDDKPVRIWTISKDSKRYRKITDDVHSRYKKVKNLSLAQLRSIGIEVLARSTTRYENLILPGQEMELECTVKNGIDLYTNYPRIKEQVDEWMDDTINFLSS